MLSQALSQIYSISTVGSIILLLVLIYIFLQNYLKLRSNFTLGLLLFSVILLFNAIATCPIFYTLISPIFDVSVIHFYIAASVFEFIALLVLTFLVVIK